MAQEPTSARRKQAQLEEQMARARAARKQSSKQPAASSADVDSMTADEVNRELLRRMQADRDAKAKNKGFSVGRVLTASILLLVVPMVGAVFAGPLGFGGGIVVVLLILLVLATAGSLSG